MGYTGRAVKGFSYIGGIRVISRVLTVVETAITGRILSPEQFGVFGIALLVLALIEIVTETGINFFLIQERDDIDEYIDTAWIVSIIRGITIALIIAVSAPLVAIFFHSPKATHILLLIAVIPLVRGFINPSEVKFQKELMFHKEFYFRSSIFFVETFFTILFILVMRSVEGLVYGMLTGVIAECVLSWLIVKPTPRFTFHIEKFRKVIHFGKWITASTILNYFYQNGDNMAVGRMLGTTSLGYYDMAYRISLVPITDIADVIKNVSFPVFVKIADDKKRLQKAFIRSLMAVLGLVVPACLILFLFPTLIIHIILGDKWLPITNVLRVLSIFGLIRAVSVFAATLFLAVEKQQVMTLVSLVGCIGLGVTIVPFVMQWGIMGAAYSALLGTALTIPVITYHLYRLFSQ